MRNPTIQSFSLIEFYQHYYNDTEQQFRDRCKQMILAARAPNHTLVNQLPRMNKEAMLKAVNNFAFKGQGLGVK